jgi:hypothetical protein
VDRKRTQGIADGKHRSQESLLKRILCIGFALCLLASALLTAQEPEDSTAAGPRAAVHGVVLNSANGQPLARALVRIEGDAANGALTDGEGRFELDGVPVGPQIFQILKPGFRDPDAMVEAGQMQSAEHNVLVAAQMPGLTFTLTPLCAIHGRVDLSTGDPAEGIVVRLLRQSIAHGRAIWGGDRFVRTDSQGNYRFGGLPGGVYALYNDPLLESAPATTLVEPESTGSVARNGYPAVFYPDARELAGAARIQLTAGDQAQANLTLTLEPFHTVTAAILPPAGGSLSFGAGSAAENPGAFPAPQLLDTGNHYLPYDAHFDDATHTVQATLPDGTYTLAVEVRGNSPGGVPAEADPAQGSAHPNYLVGSTQFSVAGQAVRNLQIPLFTPHSSLLRLRVQRSSSSGQGGVFPAPGLGAALRVSLGYAGEYRMQAGVEKTALNAGPDTLDLMLAPPFSYWVHTSVYGKGLCAGSFNANGLNLAREPLVLSFTGSPTPMEFTLRDDCARLTLSLPSAAAALAPGIEPVYIVYVVPDFDTTEEVEGATLRPTSGGSVTMEALTPGSYHVYAFASPRALEFRNPAALAQLPTAGQAVTLTPGGTENLVLEVPEQ